MKRTVLINLICSFVAVLVVALGVIFMKTVNDITMPKLVIRSEGASAVYDGTPLSNSEWELVSGELKEGHILSVEVLGLQTDVGSCENTISAKILNEKGKDVSDKYNIECLPGTLEVTPRDIIITAESDIKELDGTPLTCDEYSVTSETGLIEEHIVTVKVEGSITEIGQVSNEVTSVVIKTQFGENITNNYAIQTVSGTLMVIPRGIVIAAGDAKKTYDGTPLTSDEYSFLSSQKLLDGHTIEVTTAGSITGVGEADNVIAAAVVKDENGNDITTDYEIHFVKGTLTVLPREITITAQSDVKQYDGFALTCDEHIVSSSLPLISDHTITAEVEGSITEVGQETNKVTNVVITDTEGNDVTSNYSIHYIEGTLTVTVCEIVITAGSASKQYDGTPLTCDEYFVYSAIEENTTHQFTVTTAGSITRVGQVANKVTGVAIKNAAGIDVTDSYSIQCVEGTLTVTECDVVITAGSASKQYDGTPLTCDEYFVYFPSGNNTGHHFAVTNEGSITEVGQRANEVASVVITDDMGNLVTSNYSIHYVEGKLIVTECEIVIIAGSSSKPYDGTPLTFDHYSIYSPIEGNVEHYFTVTLEGSITEIGQEVNKVTDVAIKDTENNSAIGNYTIRLIDGTLTVTKRQIFITANSAEKQYDGTPLTCNQYTIMPEGALLSEHTIHVTIEGSITNPGYTPNLITNVSIQSSTGVDTIEVGTYYSIETYDGMLVVYDVAPPDGGDGGVESRPTGSLSGGQSQSNEVMFTVFAEESQTLYLKMESFGDYDLTSKSFLTAPEYQTLTSNGQSAYYLTSYALENGGMNTHYATIKSLCGWYVLPYYTQRSNSTQTSDAVIAGEAASPYNVEYYYFSGTSGVVVPSKYNDYESAYYENFVKQNYCNIDPATYAFMQGIIAEEEFSADDNNIINKVAQYIQQAADYNLEYNPALDTQINPIIAFLSEYKEGVCRHYAAAATMLFRALGIPARYTVGYLAETKAGVEVEVLSKQGHAWVEVYVPTIGWVVVEVTGSPAEEIPPMQIKPVDVREQYTEGKVLQPIERVTGFVLGERDYTYSVSVDGSVTGLGKAKTTITEFIIYDPNGIPVYQKSTGLGAQKFNITYKDGVLHQYLSKVSFSSEGEEKEYDGTPLVTSENISVEGNVHSELGYTYLITPTGFNNSVGTSAATYTVAFFKDGVECTDHFYIVFSYGKLTLTAKEITISAGSAEKPYDGTPLTCDDIVYDASHLAPNDRIEAYTIVGSQKNIGASANVLKDIVIVNDQNQDVTKNYTITIQDGSLVVTKP